MDDDVLERINKAALKFLEPLNSEETYRLIGLEAIKLVGANYSSIYLEIDNVLLKVYSSHSRLFKVKARKKGFTYRAFKQNRPFVVGENRLIKIHPEVRKMGVRSVVYIPLIYRNRALGVLSLDSLKKAEFSDRELEILILFGSMAMLAIKKSQLDEESRKAIEIRDRFISIAGHELRTPLTAMNGYIQLLQKKFVDGNGVESRWVKQLSVEGKRMQNLVRNILDINRIKANKYDYQLEECHVKEIVDKVVAEFKNIHPELNIDIYDGIKKRSDIIIGDRNRLIQALDNILDNAAKFSPQDSSIKISLSCQRSYLVIAVKDEGEGIRKSDLPKLFEGLNEGIDNVKAGMGFGLFLVKSIIEYHRGLLSLSSERNKGTVVEIKLPVAKYE